MQKHNPIFNLTPLTLENNTLTLSEGPSANDQPPHQPFSWHETAIGDNGASSNATSAQQTLQQESIALGDSIYESLIPIKPFQSNDFDNFQSDFQPGKIENNALDVANFEPPASNNVQIFYEAATDAEFAQAAGIKTQLELPSEFDYVNVAADALPALTPEIYDSRLIQEHPLANPDINTYREGTSINPTGNVLVNDTANGNVLIVSNPGTYDGIFGTLTLDADGSYTYVHKDPATHPETQSALNTPGDHHDIFTYGLENGDTSTLTINIIPVETPPVTPIPVPPQAHPDFNSYTEGTDTSVTGDVVTNDSTNNGGTLTVANYQPIHGTFGDLTLNPDGTYIYSPHDPSTDAATLNALNTPGSHQDVFNYTDTNASGATTSSTLTVTINTDPQAHPDFNSYTEGTNTPVTGDVISNDSTNKGGDLTVANYAPIHGTFGDLTLNPDGTYIYSPHDPSTDAATLNALNTPGSHQDVFNYTDTNASGATTSSTLTVTINTDPQAHPDFNSYTEGTNTPVTGDVISNDSTNKGGDLTVANYAPIHGTFGDLTLNPDGTYIYSPHDPSTDSATLNALNTPGSHQDVFNYTDTNASGATTSSTLTVTINTDPQAHPDFNSYTEGADTSVTGDVVTNDSTNKGGDLTVANYAPIHGTFGDLTLNPDGTYIYSPHDPSTDAATLNALNTPGSHQDVFHYTDTNASGETTSSTLTVTINTDPQANPDFNSYTEGTTTPVTGNVVTNDSTNKGGDLTVANYAPIHGTYGDLTLNQDGTYIYSPHDPSQDQATLNALNTAGPHQDVFNYTDTNASGATTSSTLTITINTGPQANPDFNSYTETTNETPSPLTGNVITNDSTNNGGNLTVTNPGTYDGTYGVLTLNQDGTYSYAPNNPSADPATLNALNMPGPHQDVFNYTDTNASGETTSSTLTVTIHTTDYAIDDNNRYIEGSGEKIMGNVLSNDSTNNGGALHVENPQTYDGTYGIITINSDGSYTDTPYNPNTNQAVQDSFNDTSVPHQDIVGYTAENTDGYQSSTTLTVTYVTDPIANPDTNSYIEGSGAPTPTGNVLTNDIANGGTLEAVENPQGSYSTTPTSFTYDGTYGIITINSDGSYTDTPITPTPGSDIANALNAAAANGGSVQDVVPYTAINSDGVTSSSTLTITYTAEPPVAQPNTYMFDSNDIVYTDNTESDGSVPATGFYTTSFSGINILTDPADTFKPYDASTIDTDPEGESLSVNALSNPSLMIDGNPITLTTTANENLPAGDAADYSFMFQGQSATLEVLKDGTIVMNYDPNFFINVPHGQQFVFTADYSIINQEGIISTSPAALNLTIEGDSLPLAIQDSYVIQQSDLKDTIPLTTTHGGTTILSNDSDPNPNYSQNDLTVNTVYDGNTTYSNYQTDYSFSNHMTTATVVTTTEMPVAASLTLETSGQPDQTPILTPNPSAVGTSFDNSNDPNKIIVAEYSTQYKGNDVYYDITQDGHVYVTGGSAYADLTTNQKLFFNANYNNTDPMNQSAPTTITIEIDGSNVPPVVEETRYGNSPIVDSTESVPSMGDSRYDKAYQTHGFPTTQETVDVTSIASNLTLSDYLVNNITLDPRSPSISNPTGDYQVTFNSEGAGYENTIGWYKIGPSGLIYDPQILFPNASAVNSGGQLTDGFTVPLKGSAAGGEIGFFLVSDGYDHNNFDGTTQTSHPQLDPTMGSFVFTKNDISHGSGAILANTHDTAPPHLFYISSVHPTMSPIEVISATGDQNGIYHTAAYTTSSDLTTGYNLDGDKLQHTVGSLVPTTTLDGSTPTTADLKIGFEDLYGARGHGSDRDFNDDIFTLNLGIPTTNYEQADSNHINADFTDANGTNLTHAIVNINTADGSGYQSGDVFNFTTSSNGTPSFTVSSTPDTNGDGYYQITTNGYRGLSIMGLGTDHVEIKGSDTHAHYQDVVDALHLENPLTLGPNSDEAAGTRDIQVQIFDEYGLASNIADIPYIITHLTPTNTTDARMLQGDQYIHTDSNINDQPIYGNSPVTGPTSSTADDIFQIDGQYNTITTGDGNDQVISTGAYTTINAGAGKDTIYISGKDETINAGSGTDYIDVGVSTYTINVASGQAIIAFSTLNNNGDTIYNPHQFGQSNSTIFDLSQILHDAGYIPSADNTSINNYVEIKSGPVQFQATLDVDPTGQGNFTAATQFAILNGVSASTNETFDIFDGNYHHAIAVH